MVMSKSRFSLVLFLFWLMPTILIAQCDLTIRLTDTFGDGWNGGEVEVRVNGFTVLGNLGETFISGYGPIDHSFSVNEDDVVTIIRTIDGAWPSEMRVEVVNAFCSTLYGVTEPSNTGADFMASCTAANPQYTTIANASSSAPYECVILTEALNGQRGCSWNTSSNIDFSSDFSFDITVNLGSNPAGADGLTFVMHNDPSGLCVCGAEGGGMGAGGIQNSLIVELDTYLNTEDRNDGLPGVDCSSSPPHNHHMDLWLNGVVNPGDCWSGARVIPAAQPFLDELGNNYLSTNGNDHIFRIAWEAATNNFTAYFISLDSSHVYASVSYSFDPMAIFGTTNPYYGFTASTGGLNNEHSFCLPQVLLPIELRSFDVKCSNSSIEFFWETATERNNDYFVIEGTNDGVTTEKIALIPGSGTTSHPMEYTYRVEVQEVSFEYYRLKQVDFDGASRSYSWVYLDCEDMNDLVVYPNPGNGMFTIKYAGFNTMNHWVVQIVDMMGRIVYLETTANSGSHSFDITHIANGMYRLQLIDENQLLIESVQLIKK